jgi:hypothetical protein
MYQRISALFLPLVLSLSLWLPTRLTASPLYAVVVSEATRGDQGWRRVVRELRGKHDATVLTWQRDVRAVLPQLRALLPDYVCFVARPEEAGRSFVVAAHRLLRRLDNDPYTDALWGIATGYDSGDALRIVARREPLTVRRGGSGTGGIGILGNLPDGFGSDEGKQFRFVVKQAGVSAEKRVEPDAIQALVEGLNSGGAQCFYTSGHATEQDWQVGYRFKGGQFRCKDGQLYGLDTKGVRHDVLSPEPKVYLPVGNCLIGHVPRRDCMALAWMRTGGAYQMFGYTAVTWYGYMGWGINDYWGGQAGRFTLAEAFFLNHQALLHRLQNSFPEQAGVDLAGYDHRQMGQALRQAELADAKTGRMKNRDLAGLLWDRDVVAFYGDPAWEARRMAADLPWRQSVEMDMKAGVLTLRVEAKRDGKWPGRPLAQRLPQRIVPGELLAGLVHQPVVTDSFVLVPMKGAFKTGDVVEVRARFRALSRPNQEAEAVLDEIETAAKQVPRRYRKEVREALCLAGPNRAGLAKAIAAVPRREREALVFLLANLPASDLEALSGERLLQTVRLASQARQSAPWEISDELFLNDVLPPFALDEDRDAWRQDFLARFGARAWACATPGAAAVILNRTLFKELGVAYHATKRRCPNQSPAESRKIGFASCTGLSILLVDACRAVGIPARIAGIPSWKDGKGDAKGNHGGNHSWVEVWSEGRWHHLGAAEDTPLERTWFARKTATASDPAHPRHRIYASSFQATGTRFPLPWDPFAKAVHAVDVTEEYRQRFGKDQP